jgi:hypothetical protein
MLALHEFGCKVPIIALTKVQHLRLNQNAEEWQECLRVQHSMPIDIMTNNNN